jgi:hypothetical protein
MEVVDEHGGAVVGQRPGDAGADALAGAGDQRPPPGEVEPGHR